MFLYSFLYSDLPRRVPLGSIEPGGLLLCMADLVTCPAQVCHFLEGALWARPPICFAKLTSVALYLEEFDIDEQPAFHVGIPLAPQQGAQGVCNALGRLVTAGVMPALVQARVLPHFHTRQPHACSTEESVVPIPYLLLSHHIDECAWCRPCCTHANTSSTQPGTGMAAHNATELRT